MEEKINVIPFPAPEFIWRSFKEKPATEEPILIQHRKCNVVLVDMAFFDGLAWFKNVLTGETFYEDVETDDQFLRWAYLPKVELDGYGMPQFD